MYESQNAGADVARALGFDPHGMVEINLRFRTGDLLVVTTEQLVTQDQLKRVTDEIVKRKFFVSEIKDENPAPVAVPADQPPKPSGVAAAAATAADVARSVAETPDERHDAATCLGEQQEPDVGEGWRLLDGDDELQPGDEGQEKDGTWVRERYFGVRVARVARRFRRRVTPAAPQSRTADFPPDVVALEARWGREDELRSEVERLRGEVERLRLLPSVQEEICAWSVMLHDARQEIKRLKAEVERLRLTPNQMELEGNE